MTLQPLVRNPLASVLVALIAGTCTACFHENGVKYEPIIIPAEFSTTIDNPLLSWIPGTIWYYEETSEDGLVEIVVEVTHETVEVMGVMCVVVHDTATLDGELIEDTYDWYAQDSEGNVWYFGEYSTEYEDGVAVGTEGSWEAGVDGARPGIVMKANPQVGDSYRQEYYKGEAEDMAEVLAIDEMVDVAYGGFQHCIKTKDWNPLEPGVVENKYYCPDVHGVVLAETVKGGEDREELVHIEYE